MLAMSELLFEEEGHRYLLASSLPLVGGDQPRMVWGVHIIDYLPSQHPDGWKSTDDHAAVGMGELPGYLAPRD